MARINGRQAKLGIDVHAAAGFGTATTCTKAIAVDSLAMPLNTSRLTNSPIGRNQSMFTNIQRGNKAPTVELTGKMGFNNGYAEMLATFFGTAAAPTEQTVGQGDYKHTILFNSTRLAFYLTMAAQATTTELFELRDLAWQEISFSYGGPYPNWLPVTFSGIANDRVDAAASQVNTYAGLTALTIPATDEAVIQSSHRFRINADTAGALANGDTLGIKSAEVVYNDPLEQHFEINGNVFNPAPIPNALYGATLVLTLTSLDTFTYITAANAGTTYKADLEVTGSQIGTGVNRSIKALFPYLRLVEDPQFTYANPGINEFVITFDAMERSANPTGMSSTMPYFEIINTLATSLLA